MSDAPFLVVAVTVVGLGLLAALVTWLLVTRSWLWRRKSQKVIIHTKQDNSVEGLLATVARDGLVLVGARWLESGGNVPMGGEVFVPKGDVAFVQYLSP